LNDGGCPIENYKVLIENPFESNNFTEVNIENEITLFNKPSINNLIVATLPVGFSAGDKFRFVVQAFNKVFEVNSPLTVPFYLISIPDSPTSAPVINSWQTNSNQITVNYQPVSNRGGSLILSYEVQMTRNAFGNDEDQGKWITISKNLSLTTITNTIIKSLKYYFRYRVFNIKSPSGWRTIGYGI